MIRIICIGKIKEKYLMDAINDYMKRLSKYHKIDLIELKDSNITEEKKLILSHINKSEYIISMCIEGVSIPQLN